MLVSYSIDCSSEVYRTIVTHVILLIPHFVALVKLNKFPQITDEERSQLLQKHVNGDVFEMRHFKMLSIENYIHGWLLT